MNSMLKATLIVLGLFAGLLAFAIAVFSVPMEDRTWHRIVVDKDGRHYATNTNVLDGGALQWTDRAGVQHVILPPYTVELLRGVEP